MADIRFCKECGRQFDSRVHRGTNTAYCSEGCERKARAAKGSSSGGSSGVSASQLTLIVPIIVIIFVIGGIGVGISAIRNAFSSTKTEIVSATCDTQEKFVEIVNNALSKKSVTKLEGDEFSTYSKQARDAVLDRHAVFTDAVYFVRLPDKVNVYLWFKTKDDLTAYVYRTE